MIDSRGRWSHFERNQNWNIPTCILFPRKRTKPQCRLTTTRHWWMIHQKYNMTGCGFVSWMKTRVLRRKRRRCLIVAKQFLNGGTKTSDGKEDVGGKEVKEGIGSPHSPLYPSSSPLLRFPAVWPGNRSVKDYSFLKYPRGVRSEDRQVFPLWKFFSAPVTNIQSSLAAGCCRFPLYPQLIRCDSWPARLCLCSASWGNHHISPRYHLSHCLNKYAAHLQIIKYSGRLWQNV